MPELNETLKEMAEFLGRAFGIIARDLGELQRELAPRAENLSEAFRRGWREGQREEVPDETRPASPPPTSATV